MVKNYIQNVKVQFFITTIEKTKITLHVACRHFKYRIILKNTQRLQQIMNRTVICTYIVDTH